MPKKILTWAAVAFLVFYVVRDPHGAATTTKTIGSAIANVGAGFGSFLSSIVGR
jgi:hypothetical protein